MTEKRGRKPARPFEPRAKRRSFTQINEETSFQIIRDKTPPEWVIHEYSPDYGIDRIIEVFKYIDEKRRSAETLSEMFFVQAKSVEKSDVKTIEVWPRTNVEVEPLSKATPRDPDDKPREIQVIPFVLETEELLTIQSMGTAMPVLLYLVTLDTRNVYYVCLNDYVEKILSPENCDWQKQASHTIYVPVRNIVDRGGVSRSQLGFYAKRNKMYGAFGKFVFQRRVIERLCNRFVPSEIQSPGTGMATHHVPTPGDNVPDSLLIYPPGVFSERNEESANRMYSLSTDESEFRAELIRLSLHFIDICKRLTFWDQEDYWNALKISRAVMTELQTMMEGPSLLLGA